jgi:hypothetical protein
MGDVLTPAQTAGQVGRRTAGRRRSPETWPTVGKAGKVLGIGPQRVRDLVASGALRAQRGPYGMRLIDPAFLEALRRKRAAGRPR